MNHSTCCIFYHNILFCTCYEFLNCSAAQGFQNMTLLHKVTSRGLFVGQCFGKVLTTHVGRYSTKFGLSSMKPNFKRNLKLVVAGMPLGAGYFYYCYRKEKKLLEDQELESYESATRPHAFLESKPSVSTSKTVKGVREDFKPHVILFQYHTCPFCSKVRTFLDYYGIPYEIVEVNPVLRQQTKWTTYKKVPIVLISVDGGYQQLNDSTMIISALKTFLMKSGDLKDIVNFYPMVDLKDEKGVVKTDILNKYFLMYEDKLPKHKTTEVVREEKKWREWADNSLVHKLSPNVYRTLDESLQTFTWFSQAGEWERLFPTWERMFVVYVGAFAMWLIGKNLKRRHNIADERQSLYDDCSKWMRALRSKETTFMGGSSPNLADLAVYGVLSSIEGCLAFKDLLENTNIGKWYYPMKEAVKNHHGKNEKMLL